MANLPNEHGLLADISTGDERAFASLFNIYQPLLYTYVLRVTHSPSMSEEIVQDVFVKIWMSRESLININSFRNYLFIVSRNHTLNFLKKMGNEQQKASILTAHLARSAHFEEERRPDYGTLIDEAIDCLPPQQQKVYLLSRHEGLKYADISTRIGIAPRTVKSYMKLAVESITRFVNMRQQDFIILLYILHTICNNSAG